MFLVYFLFLPAPVPSLAGYSQLLVRPTLGGSWLHESGGLNAEGHLWSLCKGQTELTVPSCLSLFSCVSLGRLLNQNLSFSLCLTAVMISHRAVAAGDIYGDPSIVQRPLLKGNCYRCRYCPKRPQQRAGTSPSAPFSASSVEGLWMSLDFHLRV